MRKYTLVFMEQKVGVKRLTAIPGPEGAESFEAVDDEAAQAYVSERFMPRLQTCVRAELSSLAIERDASGAAIRLVDDSMSNPHFQESYIRYDVRSKRLEVDFVSTSTGMLPLNYERSTL